MNFPASIRIAKTDHRRFVGARHEFSYSLPYVWVEVGSFTRNAVGSSLFGVDRFALWSIYQQDYLDESDAPIVVKLADLRAKWKLPEPEKSYLLTLPRCGFAKFNPVSFYFDVDEKGAILSVFAEVTNTYRDKHIIVIPGDPGKLYIDNRQAKNFHVSPFLSDTGTYHFRIRNSIDHIEIHIRLIKDAKAIFYANLIETETHAMTTATLLKTTLRFPVAIVATLPRIFYQAAILYFGKRQAPATRPVPTHSQTIRKRPPTWIELICMRLVFRRLNSFPLGRLVVTVPNGTQRRFGSDSKLSADWRILDYSVFTSIVVRGEIGMGEGYVDGFWASEDLKALLTYFLRNRHHAKIQIRGSKASVVLGKIGHWLRRNTVANSRTNIQSHYDLSNSLYRLFLDDQMNYSSAFFESPDQSLELAQIAKLDRLIQRLHIDSTHHVLEIGSGWGAAAIRMVQTTGCSVTTLTLSQAQFDEVTRRVHELGLSSKIKVLLQDYRDHQGKYDRILSIEMIEAVGHDYLPNYFKSIDTLLGPNGIVAIQAITVPDQRYSEYRRRVDWIQKYIFPGGHLPSLAAIQSILLKDTQLGIDSIENIGPHYATTLAHWRTRFLTRESEVKGMGFDAAFVRKWVYYLTYCESGFTNRYINTLQMVLTRPVNKDLIAKEQRQ